METIILKKGRFNTYKEAKKYHPFGKNGGVAKIIRRGKVLYAAKIKIRVSDTVHIPNSEVGF